jgi:hypothetical protein
MKPPSVRDHRQWTVIIAMIAMRMVQVSINQIIDVVPMWNRLMTAARPMPMRRIMSATTVLWRTSIGIRCSYFDYVFIDTPVMHMMQMAVVEIIDVALMSNRDMTAAWTVDVRTIRVSALIGGWHD